MIRGNPKKYLKSMTRDFAEKVSAVFTQLLGNCFEGKLFFSQVLISLEQCKRFCA